LVEQKAEASLLRYNCFTALLLLRCCLTALLLVEQKAEASRLRYNKMLIFTKPAYQ
jgi:hypothetical protein